MFVHLEDGAELSMLADNQGNTLLVCSQCQKVWTGTMTVSEAKTATAGVVGRMFATASALDPAMLPDMGVDDAMLAEWDVDQG